MSILISCGAETPTEAPGSSDEVAAAMVALAVGEQSNGFAAMVEDAWSVAEIAGTTTAPSSVSTSIVRAAGLGNVRPNERFIRRIEGDNVVSEWRMSYRPLSYGSDSGAGAVEVRSDGVFRSSIVTMQGETIGTLEVRQNGGNEGEIIGGYTCNGSIDFHGDDVETYSAVKIILTWNRLRLRDDGGERKLGGVVDVSISANGPHGIMSKNGRLMFDGTNRAMLSMSGREFAMDVRRGLKR